MPSFSLMMTNFLDVCIFIKCDHSIFLWFFFLTGNLFLKCKNLFAISNPLYKLISSSQMVSENLLHEVVPHASRCLHTEALALSYLSVILFWAVNILIVLQYGKMFSVRIFLLTVYFLNTCCFSSLSTSFITCYIILYTDVLGVIIAF